MKYKLYPNYKETKIRWIGEIPREWETYRLKVFIPSVQNGQWGEEPEDKSPMNYITLRVADFLEYTFDLHKELTVRKIQNTKIRLNEGDLVIEKSGGGEKQLVGRVVQLRGSFKNKKYTYSNFLGKLEIHDRMDKTYLNYYFKNLYNNRVNYNYIKQTTGIQNLDVDSLIKNEYFSFPNNKKEQVKIANFLDKKIAEIDKLIEKDKKLIELLQERRIALINHVVTKGLNPNTRLKDSGIEWIGKIPDDWEVCKLKNRAEERKIKNNFKEKNDTIFIGLENIEGETGKLLSTSTTENIDGESYTFKKNDVLFGKLRPYLAKVLKVNFDGTCTGELIIFCSIRSTDPKYLFYRLISKSFIKLVDSMTYGAKMPRVSPYEIGNMKIGWPSLIEQQKIANYLDEKTSKIDSTIKKIQQKINLLEEYKKSLIHHIVTGKVDVRSVKV